jgi:hypothetical protein
MNIRILAQNILNNPSEFTEEDIVRYFKEYAIWSQPVSPALEIHIRESFDLVNMEHIPNQILNITEEQFQILKLFADITKDEDLKTTYVLNKCSFKVLPRTLKYK